MSITGMSLLLKLTEEVGEVADASIGMRGLNSRKGICRTLDDLLAEEPGDMVGGQRLRKTS
jgi:NTP pyrophosphatase (non-canonical NTP hydrolase)